MDPQDGTSAQGREPVSEQAEIVRLSIPAADLAALDRYVAKRPSPRPDRSELILRIVQDRLIHEGFLEPRQGIGVDDPTRGESGLRPDQLNATNDD